MECFYITESKKYVENYLPWKKNSNFVINKKLKIKY